MKNFIAFAGALKVHGTENLPQLGADKTMVGCAGFSSGAAMTNQMAVSSGKTFKGFAVDAGAPYFMTEGATLDTRTMLNSPQKIDISGINEKIHEFAKEGKIDDPENLKGKPVYLAVGEDDKSISAKVVARTKE